MCICYELSFSRNPITMHLIHSMNGLFILLCWQTLVVECLLNLMTNICRLLKELEVKQIIKSVLDEHLNDKEYSPEMCSFNSRICADCIKDRVKKLSLPRYKFICLVHMGQIGQQTMRVASRCSWDTRVDNFAEYSYVNDTLWAVGLVYGFYYE